MGRRDDGRGERERVPSGAGEAKRRKFGDGSDTEEDEGAAKQKRLDDKPTDLICLGVNYTTTGETFKKHFEQFGEVVSADVSESYKRFQRNKER